jgi:hypothetical protein
MPETNDHLAGVCREMYETTIPFGEPQLMRASAFERYIDELPTTLDSGEPVDARISTLSSTLRADLMRHAERGGALDVIEVIAACVRHASRVTIHLQCHKRVVPLTVFAYEHLVHSPVDIDEFVEWHLPGLRVLHVEPALLRPPGDAVPALVAPLHEHHPLPGLLWELALRGGRSELLPEIGGPAVYRVASSLDVATLPASGPLLAAIRRLRDDPLTLSGLSELPGLDRERAARLLNALYLQAGLIVSRSHPNGLLERRRKR